jgi:uncharacterized protein
MKRREFLDFMGRGALLAGLAPSVLLEACSGSPLAPGSPGRKISSLGFTPILPATEDRLLLAPELSHELLISMGDPIGPKLKWGANNDFNAYFPFDSSNPFDGMLWTNHECPEPFLVTNSQHKNERDKKSRAQVLTEMDSVGGSLVRFHKDKDGRWKVDPTDPRNRRFHAHTRIPLIAPRPIAGSLTAVGTFANCAGGKTPWGTILTCEENYFQYFGEWDYSPLPGETKPRKLPLLKFNPLEDLGWSQRVEHRPPTHYGWVVEIHPFTGRAKKLTALGRFPHEGATCVPAKDGRTVVYMGEDKVDRFLYKFIPERAGSLETGTLFVASLEQSRWLPLEMSAHPKFAERFRDQLDLLIQAPMAAEILGATPLDRPEDIERDPATGDIIVALTNNKLQGRPHGSLLRLSEEPLSLEFSWKTWVAGGPSTGLSCPDNMAFDRHGNLWVTSDMSAYEMRNNLLPPFKNNGLYCVPMRGPEAGKIFQAASAPVGAELTGPEFLPDGSLLLSVQHPGEVVAKEMPSERSSRWPDGKPRSSLVVVKMPQ